MIAADENECQKFVFSVPPAPALDVHQTNWKESIKWTIELHVSTYYP